jgi:hypothetical protein
VKCDICSIGRGVGRDSFQWHSLLTLTRVGGLGSATGREVAGGGMVAGAPRLHDDQTRIFVIGCWVCEGQGGGCQKGEEGERARNSPMDEVEQHKALLLHSPD